MPKKSTRKYNNNYTSSSSDDEDSDFENASMEKLRLDKRQMAFSDAEPMEQEEQLHLTQRHKKKQLPLRSTSWNQDFEHGKYEGSVVEKDQIFAQQSSSEKAGNMEPALSAAYEKQLEQQYGHTMESDSSSSSSDDGSSQNHHEHDEDLEKIRNQLAQDDHLLMEDSEHELVGSLAQQRKNEIRRAQHVQRQKILWDNILKLRISLQKPLDIVNRLPTPVSNRTKSDEKLGQQLKTTLHQLLSLQNSLLDSYSQGQEATAALVSSSRKRKKPSVSRSTISIEPFREEELEGLNAIENNQEIEENLDSIWNLVKHSYQRWNILRERSINTWNRKTQQGAVSSRHASLKSINADATEQVKRQLKQMKKLIRDTQVQRFPGKVLGKRKRSDAATTTKSRQRCDPEIFDDRDFYQSLLSNLIQDASANSSRMLEKSNQPPQKKKKHNRPKTRNKTLQYVTVTELVGFMAPEPKTVPAASRALFNGLFGKKKCVDEVNTFEYMSDDEDDERNSVGE